MNGICRRGQFDGEKKDILQSQAVMGSNPDSLTHNIFLLCKKTLCVKCLKGSGTY